MELQFTFKRPCLEISGEVGSLGELIGYMQEQSATLTLAFGDDMELVVQRIGGGEQQEAGAEAPKKPGRKPKPAVEAIAPAPLPVPATATLPPNTLNAAPVADLTIPADGGVPPFLARAPALAPPLAPPAPAAPPPVGVLGPKVVAALDALKKSGGATDPDGQKLADWLAAAGATIKGVTYDEACRAVLMISDEKLTAAGIPAALKVA